MRSNTSSVRLCRRIRDQLVRARVWWGCFPLNSPCTLIWCKEGESCSPEDSIGCNLAQEQDERTSEEGETECGQPAREQLATRARGRRRLLLLLGYSCHS